MADELEKLKKIVFEGASETIGKLWDSDQDKRFLLYSAEKLAKYALKLQNGTAEEKKEAQFNLDMVKASIAAYFHQKQIVAEKGVEQIATQVAGLIVKLVIAAV